MMPRFTPGVKVERTRSFGAEIVLHPNGHFLYASIRGCDLMAVFAVEADGSLRLIQNVPSVAKFPRSFTIDPSGKWMLIASQDGHKVGVFEVDAKTGGAKETDVSVKTGSPVCVKFVAIQK